MTNLKKTSNPFSTGGGGTSFEYRVGACYLTSLLHGKIPPGLLGVTESVRFQAREMGVPLDDILVTTNDGQIQRRLMLQVKHDLTFSENDKAFREVVAAAWAAYTSELGWRFNEGIDQTGIGLGIMPGTIQKHLLPLLDRARECLSGKEFVQKETAPGFSGATARRYLVAVRSALDTAAGRAVTDDELLSFIKHLVVMHFDLEHAGSRDATAAWNDLLDITPERDPTQAVTLFDVLVAQVSSLAPRAGTVDACSLRYALGQRMPQLFLQPEFSGTLTADLYKNAAVFVPPAEYQDAKVKLLKYGLVVIAGPSHVGKTSTAYQLALDLSAEQGRRVVRIEPHEGLGNTQHPSDLVIVINDCFEGSNSSQDSHALDLDSIVRLSRRNPVIMTTRSQALSRAQQSTRLGEDQTFGRYLVELKQEGSYDNHALDEILTNHLEFMQSDAVAPQYRLRSDQVALALLHKYDIVQHLRFPHNIERLCSAHLADVDSEASLHKAIRSAGEIEAAVKGWAEALDPSQRWFVFLVALFPGIAAHTLNAVYRDASRRLHLTPDDVARLALTHPAYISNPRRPALSHPSFHEAIVSLLRERYADSVGDIVDIGLREVLKAEPLSFGQCVNADYGWPRFAPGQPVPIEPYLEQLSEAYNLVLDRLFPQVRDRVAPYTGGKACALFLTEQGAPDGVLMLVPAVESGPNIQVELPPDIARREDEIMQQAWDARKPIAASDLHGTDLAHRSPQMHAFAIMRREVQKLVERHRLKEAWPVVHARVEGSLRQLGSSWLGLRVDWRMELDTKGCELLFQEFQRIATGALPPHLPPGAWERIIAAESCHLLAVDRGLKILELHGRTYTGPLLPQPDRQGSGWICSFYSTDQMKATIRRSLELSFESYRWMVENNFLPIRGEFPLYRNLPVKVLGATAYGQCFGSERRHFYFLPSNFMTLNDDDYELYVAAEHQWQELEPPPFPETAEHRLSEASSSEWVRSFGRSLSGFCSPKGLITEVYKWLGYDLDHAVKWAGIGRDRSSHFANRADTFAIPGASVYWDLTRSHDPWELSDWPP